MNRSPNHGVERMEASHSGQGLFVAQRWAGFRRSRPALGGHSNTPSMKEPIEFTDRERFVLSYYRDPHLSSWSRHAAMDGIYLGTSIFFVVLTRFSRTWPGG